MSSTRLKILVSDDSMFSRKLMTDTINEYSVPDYECEIYEAKDGLEAVNTYTKVKPDIVFMDLTMPQKSGLEAMKEIIQFDASAKIVIVSSSITGLHTKQIIDGGAYSLVQKPFEAVEIMSILDRIIVAKDGK